MQRRAKQFSREKPFPDKYRASLVVIDRTAASRLRRPVLGVSVIIFVLLTLALPGEAQRGGGASGGGAHSSAAVGGHSSGGHFSTTGTPRGVGSRAVEPTRATSTGRSVRRTYASGTRRMARIEGAGKARVWGRQERSFGARRRRRRLPFGGGFGFLGPTLGWAFYGFWMNDLQDCEPLEDGTLPPDCDVLSEWGGDADAPASEQEEYGNDQDGNDPNRQGADEGQVWVPSIYEPASQEAPERATAPKPVTLLYLKNGFSYGATSYWLTGERLHYVTSYGGENSVSVDQVDLQKTVDANATRGVRFALGPQAQ